MMVGLLGLGGSNAPPTSQITVGYGVGSSRPVASTVAAVQMTAPLIGYYYAKGKLTPVDGLADIDEVSRQIAAAFDV